MEIRPAARQQLSRRFAAGPGIALLMTAVLAGCGTTRAGTTQPAADPPPETTSGPSTTPAVPDPEPTSPGPTPTVASAKLTDGRISVRISGAAPAVKLVPGGPARTFTVQVGNGTARSYKDVRVVLSMEPYMDADGGIDPKLTLQRLDAASGKWLKDSVIVGLDAGFLGAPPGGGALRAGTSRIIQFRIAASRGAPLSTGTTVSAHAVVPAPAGQEGKLLAGGSFQVQVTRNRS